MEEGVRRVEAKVQKTSVKVEQPLDQIMRSAIPDAHPFNILDLSIGPRKQGYFKNFKTPNPDEGILYLLKDKNSGDIMKVGHATIQREHDPVWHGRLKPYRAVQKKFSKRQLELVMFLVPEGQRTILETWEKEVREALKNAGYALPWDNSKTRLGRKGPGVPGLYDEQLDSEVYLWLNETTIIIKGGEVYWAHSGSSYQSR
jgi:hypothetical protein